ncbi:MAG: site-2 protease family protein, partial [Chlamydiota bacterium]|nr:site-2 protease family protein [Chlamydiota bacterium]
IIGLSAKFGFVFFLGILAMISVNLGILNLLPIPVLDGGHLLINGIESVRHKAIDRKTLAAIQYVFLVVLLTLIVIVTYNDIKRLSEGLFSRPQKSHSISGR